MWDTVFWWPFLVEALWQNQFWKVKWNYISFLIILRGWPDKWHILG